MTTSLLDCLATIRDTPLDQINALDAEAILDEILREGDNTVDVARFGSNI